MNQNRYKVQGKRMDDGELIKGFPVAVDYNTGECTEICIGGSGTTMDGGKRREVGYCYKVDPNTVEPIAVKPTINQDGYWDCPNCGQGLGKMNYCIECGQRLVWD